MKTCKAPGCTTRFKAPGFIVWCSPTCGASIAQDRLAKKRAKESAEKAKQERAQVKARKEKLKSRSDYIKDAQREFNRFIVLRDSREPCISCRRHHDGRYHAGHFLSVGSHPELRFDEDNVHKQCAPCNMHLHGNLIAYRMSLVERKGMECVSRLEGPTSPKHYTKDELIAIKTKYRQLSKELEKT